MPEPAVDIDMGEYPELLSYPQEGKIKEKLDQVKSLLRTKYNVEAQIFTRVPGRVNLIGEHVDYCGYSVCPMAIEQDIVIAAATIPGDGDFFKICNLNRWCGYVLCGIKAAMSLMGEKQPMRMIFAISGNIPPGSGLSSSSALVCASLLTAAHLNNLKVNKTELAELSAKCERFIGVEGGGMDQAIAFLATEGCAKHIEFNPVRTQDVQLPNEAVFVIGHSLTTKRKAESSDYNIRVVECRMASQIIAKKCGLNWRTIRTVAPLQSALGVSLTKLQELINEHLNKDLYTKLEICKELNLDENELNSLSLTPNTLNLREFKLCQRITHVVTEALRVELWLKEKSIEGLGKLMIASHLSMKEHYEASDPQCDKLVEAALNAGALGSRITGAGWGGCVVSLTTRDYVETFLKKLKKSFYNNYQGNIDEVLFKTEPQRGANLFMANVQVSVI